MKKVLVILISLVLILSSCSIKEPIVSLPTDFNIDSINYKDKSLKLTITVPIENPNNISFNITDGDIDLLLNNNSIGRIQKLEKIEILANSNQDYPISFELNTKDLKTSIISLISDLQNENPQINVKGHITFSKYFLQYKVKFDEHKSF